MVNDHDDLLMHRFEQLNNERIGYGFVFKVRLYLLYPCQQQDMFEIDNIDIDFGVVYQLDNFYLPNIHI